LIFVNAKLLELRTSDTDEAGVISKKEKFKKKKKNNRAERWTVSAVNVILITLTVPFLEIIPVI
jgi:hypothetical protein